MTLLLVRAHAHPPERAAQGRSPPPVPPRRRAFANDVAKQQGKLAGAGSSVVMITIGDSDKVNLFLDANPEIPRELLFADSTDSFDAYAAANFGKIGDVTPENVQLKAPEGVAWLKYLRLVMRLSPIKKWNEVPEGVTKLGGTFVLDKDDVLYGWADAIPGDYPPIGDVLSAAGAA